MEQTKTRKNKATTKRVDYTIKIVNLNLIEEYCQFHNIKKSTFVNSLITNFFNEQTNIK